MIITLTPNPSVDRTMTIPQIRFNTILRTDKVRLDWGGTGFNVSRSLRVLGLDSLALGWVGGGAGRMLEDGLHKLGVQTDFVWVEEETRTNTIVLEEGGQWYVKLNEPGPHIPQEAVEAILEKARSYAEEGDIWVASGSLPQDVPEDFYARLIKLLKAKGVRVFFDANANVLRLGCAEGPYLVKPNAEEAEAFVGFKIQNQEDGKRAVLPFLRLGISYVALTIGDLGLLLASQKEMIWAAPPEVLVRNVTGAGDSLMAGLIAAFTQGLPLLEVARWGVAAGTVSVMHEGVSQMPLEDFKAMMAKIDSRVINVM